MNSLYNKFSIIATAILLFVVLALTLNSTLSGDKKKTPTTKEYSVSFYDEDEETELQTIKVKEGQKAEIETPTKPSTQYLSFTFSNWAFENGDDATESLENVTQDLTVYARYTEEDRYYHVTFLQMDRKELMTLPVKAGQACEWQFSFDPPYDEDLDYTFECWVDENGNDMTDALSCVLEDLTVIAKYKTSPKTFSLRFETEYEKYIKVKHGDGGFFSSVEAVQFKLKKGSIITIKYEVPDGFSDLEIIVSGADVLDEQAGTYRVTGDVVISAFAV